VVPAGCWTWCARKVCPRYTSHDHLSGLHTRRRVEAEVRRGGLRLDSCAAGPSCAGCVQRAWVAGRNLLSFREDLTQ
jgi:hypothetical protein